MDARRNIQLRLRAETFGGVCYVPHRDDFFAIDKPTFAFIQSLRDDWTEMAPSSRSSAAALAKLGICETRTPATREIAYSGPSFIGTFRDIVTLPEPLVINCFATAYCPLKCVYCHADDLMMEFRNAESEDDIENVAATASLIPAMVAVITGGDPLSRPDRAATLIQRLAPQKALVLDTSGVGDINTLMPLLKKHNVHVRISIDAVSDINHKLRLPNKDYLREKDGAFIGATRTLSRCIEEGIAVTVQSVVTSLNDNLTELLNLRDWLVLQKVRHWVLHITVKGGSARRIEEKARKQKGAGIVPSSQVYARIKDIIDDTNKNSVPIDIRCTDTGNTPNSVLLLGSKGDLFTEGLAHNGKVKLFSASEARPDLIRQYWHHVDPFGHARRYLNWNPWFYEGISLESLCYDPLIKDRETELASVPGVIEIEAKYKVIDLPKLSALLSQHAELVSSTSLQRDEYYDTKQRVLGSQDFVVRVRKHGEKTEIGFKGSRFRTPEGEYSRVELEFASKSSEELRAKLHSQDLECTWYFEKRRTAYSWKDNTSHVVLDEIPEIGYFIEIEGSLKEIRKVAETLHPALGEKETRNYKELFVAHRRSRGDTEEMILGAQFD